MTSAFLFTRLMFALPTQCVRVTQLGDGLPTYLLPFQKHGGSSGVLTVIAGPGWLSFTLWVWRLTGAHPR
jgi:hypothetical protein